MKYVNNEIANKQINLIAKYVKQGLSDSEILSYFDEIETNLKSGNSSWTEIEIRDIREGFNLDANVTNITIILSVILRVIYLISLSYIGLMLFVAVAMGFDSGVLEILCHFSKISKNRNDTCLNNSISIKPWLPCRTVKT